MLIDLPACGVDSWSHRGFLGCLTVVFGLLVILFPWAFVLKKKQIAQNGLEISTGDSCGFASFGLIP